MITSGPYILVVRMSNTLDAVARVKYGIAGCYGRTAVPAKNPLVRWQERQRECFEKDESPVSEIRISRNIDYHSRGEIIHV